jgi:hypothetical protein
MLCKDYRKDINSIALMCQLTRCSLVALHANSCSSKVYTLAKTAYTIAVLAARLIEILKLKQNNFLKIR